MTEREDDIKTVLIKDRNGLEEVNCPYCNVIIQSGEFKTISTCPICNKKFLTRNLEKVCIDFLTKALESLKKELI